MTTPTQPESVPQLVQELTDLVQKDDWVKDHGERTDKLHSDSQRYGGIVSRYFTLLQKIPIEEVPDELFTDHWIARNKELLEALGLSRYVTVPKDIL
ncbi:MAG TPA: hypothetical protein VJI97_02795 [Candidatus Nanoarchaeia archaeon]|nr:hypothetical protein [Candidatus Nanoarchaeia archaeon]